LESLPAQLRDECGWGMGYEEELNKTGGGIGADGATIISLVLGVVGAVPTVSSLLTRLRRAVPACPPREEAWDTATWAVAMQYGTVPRRHLHLLAEARHQDHWVLTMSLPDSGDEFPVDVYGSRGGTMATQVVWTNGQPWGRKPGQVEPGPPPPADAE